MLNLYYLKYFCDAVKYEGISTSAKKNFVTQSAVSQAIQKLESHYGVKLITHHPNRLKLTHQGELLYEMSKILLDKMIDIHDTLTNGTCNILGKVEFACTHSYALTLLPQILKNFKKKFPYFQVTFKLGHSGLIKKWVKNGQSDFGVVIDNEDFSQFNMEKIHEGFHQLFYSSELKSTDDLPFILSEERKEILTLKQLYYKKFKKEFIPISHNISRQVSEDGVTDCLNYQRGCEKWGSISHFEVSSWEVIANLAEQGLGIGFIPDYVAQNRNLTVLNLGLDDIPYSLLAISHKNAHISKGTMLLIDMMKKNLI